MKFVFSLSDLGIWLAISSLVLILAAELTSPYYASRTKISFNRKRIRRVAVATAIASIVVALIWITFSIL